MATRLYETDFYGWLMQQSHLLKTGEFKQLDITNLVEELQSLGKQQRQELRNRLGVLLGHFLKWQFQPEKRTKSWRATIREQRREIVRLMNENPSLQPYVEEAMLYGYQSGLDLVVRETPLDYPDLPEDCIYNFTQVCDANFSEFLHDF